MCVDLLSQFNNDFAPYIEHFCAGITFSIFPPIAWEKFNSSKYMEALACVDQIDSDSTAGVQFLLVKLFKANCFLHLVSCVEKKVLANLS